MQSHNLIRSALVGAVVAITFVVIITIAGELYKVVGADGKAINPIKDFLKAQHGHHWVGKSIWSIALFFITTAAAFVAGRSRTEGHSLVKYVWLLTIALLLGTAVLYGFFTYEYIAHH